MKNGTNTKKALMLSISSLLVCCVLFIGSTFAWFTDSASVRISPIKSGSLDIDLVDAEGVSLDKKTIGFKKADGHESEEIIWEPGCTYELQPITVVNKGNLALSYKLVITGIAGDAKLNEAIEWTAQINGQDIALENYTKLLEKGQSETLTVKGHMREDAGSEFMGLTLAGVSISAVASQAPVEYDSNNNTYDKFSHVSSFDFTDSDSAKFFCPECYNTGADNAFCEHEPTLKIEDGVAKIEKVGAWLEYSNLDWKNNYYVMEYDVNVSALENGAAVGFDSGETTAWTDLRLSIKNIDGVYYAYNNLNAAGTALGTIKSSFHVKYTFTMKENGLALEMTVSDDTNKYNVQCKSNATNPKLCWNVYTVQGGSAGAEYGSIDNFSFCYVPVSHVSDINEFKNALEKGGKIVLDSDIAVEQTLNVAKDDVILDFNNNAVTVTPNVGFNITGDNVTVKNGTFKRAQGVDYSYGLRINGRNTVIENITIDSGINVSGYNPDDSLKDGVNVQIRNCNVTADNIWSYYAVCVQGGASVTVTDSTLTKNNPGKANYYLWIEKEFTDELGYVPSSSLTMKNVTLNSNCNAQLYLDNGIGIAPVIID